MVEGFIDFLAESWGKSFCHQYQVPRRGWRNVAEEEPTGRFLWKCTNLKEALNHYTWNGKTFEDNRLKLRCLQSRLAMAIDSNRSENRGALSKVCFDIFAWGGVARKTDDPSRQWITRHANEDLNGLIARGVQILKSGKNMKSFDGCTLLMNSAMTKVYSIADLSDRLIIYDGRVGAALGLLARKYLAGLGIEEIPQGLRFRWGDARRSKSIDPEDRNPSHGKYIFERLFVGRDKDYVHAKLMSRTSRLIVTLSKRLKVTPRQVEAALFMVGYKVKDPN